jgi:hypothetical protein
VLPFIGKMKIKLLVYLLSLTSYCLGQNYYLVDNESEKYYKVLNDSFNPNLKYPDGRYKLFLLDSDTLPNKIFNLKNGKVTGSYLELNQTYWKYGNYLNDSMMTFFTSPNDTTFKIGTWKTTYSLYSSFSKSYDNYSTLVDNFKMPFDNDGQFTEIWEYHNGQIARSATYVQGFGLKKETYWNFETNDIFKETINSGSSNYYQSIVYKNDSIKSVWLIQNGVEIEIDFNSKNNWGEPKCAEVSIFENNNNTVLLPITTISIDSSKSISRFSYLEKRISIQKDKDGNTNIIYPNRLRKKRLKKLRINN